MEHLVQYVNEINTTDALKMYAREMSLNFFERIYLYARLVCDHLLVDLRPDLMRSIATLRDEIVFTDNAYLIHAFNDAFTNTTTTIDRRRVRSVIAISKKPTFYTNRHNVHSLSTSTIGAAKELMAAYPATYTGRRPFEHVFFDMIELHETFDSLNVLNLFASVWRFINESQPQQYSIALHERLREEMDESVGTCLTGHVCRLMNVLRGYVGDTDKFVVAVDDYEYYKAKTFNRLTSMIVDYEDPATLLADIKTAINTGVIEIDSDHIVKVLVDYTGEDWYRNDLTGEYSYL